jgi:hypothetical protein
MHYWNKDNFEGLADLARDLEARERCGHLAEYCRCRHSGLRREAFAALERFLADAKGWEPAAAREIAITILELRARTPQAHQFLTQPLLERFLLPTLKAWVEDAPTSLIPVRWLGILNHDPSLLSRVLAASPDDIPVRRILTELQLSQADYATHHLVEGTFLGDPDATRAALARATTLVEASPQPEAVADLSSEIEHYEGLVADWLAYCASPEGTFPDWCAARGRAYRWPTIVYYDEGSV